MVLCYITELYIEVTEIHRILLSGSLIFFGYLCEITFCRVLKRRIASNTKL